MGNCQAAEADMLVIQHPGGRMERFYLQMTASQVMAANPGHYVAVIVTAPLPSSSGTTNPSGKMKGTGGTASVQLLKLLSPDDNLRVGHFYYLVTFEDVLKVFGSKKCIKLSKLLGKQERRKRSKHHADGDGGGADARKNSSSETVEESEKNGDMITGLEISGGIGTTNIKKCGQWKPTLQSIAEVGQ
ncbi:D-ribose-binding periplasmic protein [Rhynchospora pubera]|uniref:D-ribose-binding periplasmic protein n=1 Tax=Rhynchospora pubera TaxID=906938 RepID=A0AAV8HHK5_9POAL|nr:D-ribose-binding periplasmic protein [Rhynchospora pubera]